MSLSNILEYFLINGIYSRLNIRVFESQNTIIEKDVYHGSSQMDVGLVTSFNPDYVLDFSGIL